MLRTCGVETVHLHDVGPICVKSLQVATVSWWSCTRWTDLLHPSLLNYHASAPLVRADLLWHCMLCKRLGVASGSLNSEPQTSIPPAYSASCPVTMLKLVQSYEKTEDDRRKVRTMGLTAILEVFHQKQGQIIAGRWSRRRWRATRFSQRWAVGPWWFHLHWLCWVKIWARHRISRREIQPKNKNQQPQAAYLQRKTGVSLQTLSSFKKIKRT